MSSPLSMHTHSPVPLGSQAACNMSPYPTQSHYADTALTSHCPILVTLNAKLGTNKYQFQRFVEATHKWDLNSRPST